MSKRFFRRLEILKHPRKWDIRAPVEDQSDYSLNIIVNQQDHRFGEIGIGEVPARHEQSSGGQILGVLGLDWKKNGW